MKKGRSKAALFLSLCHASLSGAKRPLQRPPRWPATACSVFLDGLEHLEDALGSAVEKTLERLRQAAALQGVATDSFAFGHETSRFDPRLYRRPQLRSLALPSTISAGGREPPCFPISPRAGPGPPSKTPPRRVPPPTPKAHLPRVRPRKRPP